MEPCALLGQARPPAARVSGCQGSHPRWYSTEQQNTQQRWGWERVQEAQVTAQAIYTWPHVPSQGESQVQ